VYKVAVGMFKVAVPARAVCSLTASCEAWSMVKFRTVDVGNTSAAGMV
jgi:hypothetical protein